MSQCSQEGGTLPPQALADCQLRMQFRVATSVDGTPVQQLPFGTVESSNCGWALAATTADLLPFEPVKLLSFKEERLDLVCACLVSSTQALCGHASDLIFALCFAAYLFVTGLMGIAGVCGRCDSALGVDA